MRILHFLPVYIPAWQYGGPVLSVSRLCQGLVSQGVDVRVITTNAGLPDFPQPLFGLAQNINGVEVFYYQVDHHHGAIHSKALVDSLANHLNWADLLHISSIWQPLGAPVQNAAHNAGIPVIQTLRGALSPYSLRRSWWKKVPYYLLTERLLLQRAAALHCTTYQEAREIAWLGLRPPVHLLPNPLDLSRLSFRPESGAAWRRSIGLSTAEPLLLVVGRMHHKKGLDFLPRVLQGIMSYPWKIVFLGRDDDGTARRLKRVLRRLGLEDRCIWLDHLPSHQLSSPYNAADYLLLPSLHENFGNVVVEALACGCGAIISDRVGVAESIRDCPGVSILPRSTKLWITHLQTLLSSERPGLLSSNWVVEYFSQSIVSRQAKTIYESILTHA